MSYSDGNSGNQDRVDADDFLLVNANLLVVHDPIQVIIRVTVSCGSEQLGRGRGCCRPPD